MRPRFVKTAVALMIGASVSLPEVHASDWNGSYSAAGECFCSGEVPGHIRMNIVPTPIGGQTVAQVCARLGKGPGLSRVNGLFNHPVYEDAQCGNGPGIPADKTANSSCAGSFDGIGADSASCFPVGPHWNLQAAYQAGPTAAATPPIEPEISAAIPETEAVADESVPADTTTSGDPPVAGNNLSQSLTELPEGAQWVLIDGRRYLRAREGIPAAGGDAGQRIVLDGFVYLRDDGNIDHSDIYQKTGKKPPSKAVTIVDTAGSAANSEPDKLANDRRVKAKRAQALRQQADARATSRQIEAQRRRIIQKKLAAEKGLQIKSEKELLRAKQRLEAESARRASAALEAHAEAQQVLKAQAGSEMTSLTRSRTESQVVVPEQVMEPEQAAPRQATIVVSEGVPESSEQEATKKPVEPAVAAARPAQSEEASVATLRLPAAVRASARNFRYLEALPVSYDVGGDGVMLEGSTSSHSRLQYFGRLGVSNRYNEVLAGGGYYLTPESASRLTFVLLAGIEYGNFELVDGQSPDIRVDYDDSGVYLAASSRMVVNNRFELKAGVGYSSLFEGDAMLFGGGYLHLTRKLDLVTRFELGDNDLLGIGIRYYY